MTNSMEVDKRLIRTYRMMGYDKPTIQYDKDFGCYTLEINNPCGQWKLIKGKHPYACIIGALKWAKANQKRVMKELKDYVDSFPRPKVT